MISIPAGDIAVPFYNKCTVREGPPGKGGGGRGLGTIQI